MPESTQVRGPSFMIIFRLGLYRSNPYCILYRVPNPRVRWHGQHKRQHDTKGSTIAGSDVRPSPTHEAPSSFSIPLLTNLRELMADRERRGMLIKNSGTETVTVSLASRMLSL